MRNKRLMFLIMATLPLVLSVVIGFSGMSMAAQLPDKTATPALSIFATTKSTCGRSFFGIPTWYEYLPLNTNCEIQTTSNIIWLIALAIINILMTLAGILAVVFVMIGGFKYVTSVGSPEQVKNAKNTIVNALIGLAIAILASQIVAFLGHKLGQ